MIHVPQVKEMFDISQRVLGYDLLSKCLNGPIEDLNQTLYAQPAIFVTSLAAVQKLKEENPQVKKEKRNVHFSLFHVFRQ